MAKLINVRLLDGHLYSIEIEDQFIKVVERQKNLIRSGSKQTIDHSVDLNTLGIVIDAKQQLFVPAMIDAHIHSRDPGFPDKETWLTLEQSAFKGGVVAVCDMPNTKPPTMDRASIRLKEQSAARTQLDVQFYLGVGSRNVAALAELLNDSSLPLCGVKIYYGQSTGNLMFDDLERLASALGGSSSKVLAFHSEDQCCIDKLDHLIPDDHDPKDFSGFRIHSQVRSSESAHASTRVILKWAETFEGPVHLAHVSTAKEIELVLQAGQRGADLSSEVAPHHLLLCDEDYEQWGPYLKVNPPVRSRTEVNELLQLFGEGRIPVFATDHAPHTISEKQTSLKYCPSGIPAIEFFLPLLFACAQKAGLSFEYAVQCASKNPADRFGFSQLGGIEVGKLASFVWLDETSHQISSSDVEAHCGWSPYVGLTVPVKVKATWHRGKQMFRASGRN